MQAHIPSIQVHGEWLDHLYDISLFLTPASHPPQVVSILGKL